MKFQQCFVDYMFYNLVNKIGNGRIESADKARRPADLQLHLQACWKVGVLQPPIFTMPKCSIMPLEFICKRTKDNLWRKHIFSQEKKCAGPADRKVRFRISLTNYTMDPEAYKA